MPQTEQERNQMVDSIDAALRGLNATSATNQRHDPNPRQGAISPAVAPNQLPSNEAERRAMAEAVSRISGGK
jgi:hypothetical protein